MAHEFQQFQSISRFIGRMSSRNPRLTLGIAGRLRDFQRHLLA